MIMLIYLFRSIPRILFEPLAVTALLWIIGALILFRKHDKVLFWTIFASVAFLCAWRIVLQSIVLSSRYSAFLIYPCVIFTACLCVKSRSVFCWTFRKLHWNFPGKRVVCRLLSTALLIGLTAACLGKTFHLNPYGNFIRALVQSYLEKARSPAFIHTQEAARISWYAGRKIRDISVLNISPRDPALPFIRKRIGESKNLSGYHYFFYYLTKGEPVPSSRNLKDVLAGGTWTVLDRRYVSKKKDREFLLAVCKPGCPNIEEWPDGIPELPRENLYSNGGFEQVLRGKMFDHYRTFYRKNEIREYLDLTARKLPMGWWPSLGKSSKDIPPDIRLREESPLAGRFSLFIDSRPPRKPANIIYWYSRKESNCRYQFFVRGNGSRPSRFRLDIMSKNEVSMKLTPEETLTFFLLPGKTYRIHGNISTGNFRENQRNFLLCFRVNGCVTVDQVSVVPR